MHDDLRPGILTTAPPQRGPAVIGSRERISYEELHARANRIAHAILDRTGGAPPGAVALLLDHDVSAIAAALGALKARGHYVALSPQGPFERAAFVLADSGARVLVTERRHAETARSLAARCEPAPAIVDVAATGGEPSREPDAAPAPADRALHVYTSGSTGWPKGVWHDHASIAEGARTYAALIDLAPGDRLSLLHGLGTMASATTLWAALLHGAAIVPCDPRQASRERLLAWIAETRVSGLHLVPTLFRRLAGGAAGDALASVRFVRLGGEAITRSDWELWRTRCDPDSRLHVGFASTEVGLVRHAVYDRFTPAPEAVLPVGDAVPGKDVLVVDADGAAVPVGQVGRVVIRGRHLFGGYHGRAAETAAVRSVDPDGRIVFQSGDLARFDARGRLFWAGRIDAQVKIDGNRVEPAEVEHALRELPWVGDAAVVTRPHATGAARLAAFVTAGTADALQRRTVRAHLRARLPASMIPATVEALDALPLLPDGKIDRRTLAARPAPAAPPPAPPRNPIEEALVEIWQRVLGTAAPDVHADFFLDLGGDSLEAVAVLGEVAELFGVELALDALYRAPTVASLAEQLLDGGWEPPGDGALVVHRGGSRPPLFGVCGMFGHALRLMLIGQALDDDQPFHGLQPPGMDWAGAGCDTIDAMAAYYRAVIRRVQPHGPYHLLGTSFGGLLAFVVACQLESEGEHVRLLAMVDTRPPDCALADRVDRAPRHDWSATVDTRDPLEAMGARVARQHVEAIWRYRLTVPFGGEIVYLRCDEPAIAPDADRRGLWSHFATGGMRTIRVPGWHGTFHREPQFSAVVAELRRRLAVGAPVG